MQGQNLRPAKPADAPSISELIQRTIRITNVRDYNLTAIKAICDEFTLHKVVQAMAVRDVFVVTVGPAIVGTISLGGERLHSLFVDPDVQGQGLGAALVVHLEKHALIKGVSTLQVSSSITARPFYEKLGFKALTLQQRGAFSTILMSKSIEP